MKRKKFKNEILSDVMKMNCDCEIKIIQAIQNNCYSWKKVASNAVWWGGVVSIIYIIFRSPNNSINLR